MIRSNCVRIFSVIMVIMNSCFMSGTFTVNYHLNDPYKI